MQIEDSGISINKLMMDIAKAINKYHRAATWDMAADNKMLLDAYHEGILATILMVKEDYEK